MSDSASLAFEATPLDTVTSRLATLRQTYRSNRTKDLQFRLVQLRKLYWAICDNEKLLADALYRDLRKCSYEAILNEVDWCKSSIIDLVENAEAWLADEPVKGLPLMARPMGHHIRNTPMGMILIIGAYNFPLMLNIPPLAGAIAAGNCVVVKPSESAPHTAMAIQRVMEQALDPECYACINGSVEQSKALLDEKWSKIAFIGGTHVGGIIARKAAETLTPVVLELGGRNPAFITRNSDIKLAARRLMFQKTMNAGQVCFSHNYVLIEKPVVTDFIAAINKTVQGMFPNGTAASPDYSRIVNLAQFKRIKKMLDGTKGRIVMGGKMDESDLFIEPTAVLVDDIQDTMMAEESFGPIWSILPVDSLDEAIEIANEVDPTPLTLSTFGSDAENEKVLLSVASGSANINDGSAHGQIHASPNGGNGTSGTGRLNGYYSLKAFSHERTVTRVPGWIESFIRVRYMPYDFSNLKRHQNMSMKKPNFDRDGNVVKGLGFWIKLLLSLGAKGPGGFVVRWGALLVLTAALGLQTGRIKW